jgi:hypothetical protein
LNSWARLNFRQTEILCEGLFNNSLFTNFTAQFYIFFEYRCEHIFHKILKFILRIRLKTKKKWTLKKQKTAIKKSGIIVKSFNVLKKKKKKTVKINEGLNSKKLKIGRQMMISHTISSNERYSQKSFQSKKNQIINKIEWYRIRKRLSFQVRGNYIDEFETLSGQFRLSIVFWKI